MKKYICVIPLQSVGDKGAVYDLTHMPKEFSGYDKKSSFPIVPIIACTAETGESLTVCMIFIGDQNTQVCKDNESRLKEELSALSKGCKINIIYQVLPIQDVQSQREHWKLLASVAQSVEDGDTVYMDITFGTKPTPIVFFMTMQYLQKAKRDVKMGGIYYGRFYFGEKNRRPDLYDITSLYAMGNMISRLDGDRKEESRNIISGLLRTVLPETTI